MKRVITFMFAMGLVLYLSNIAIYAQGKGTGHGPDVSSGHGPDSVHGNSSNDHGKSAGHVTTDTKGSHDNTDWVNHLNPNLQTKLTNLIPTDATVMVNGVATKMTLADVAAGFKTKGQCIAFLHVAKNNNLTTPQWLDMRNRMTGSDHESLGKALHDAVPTLSTSEVKTETEKAEKQTTVDLQITTKPTS